MRLAKCKILYYYALNVNIFMEIKHFLHFATIWSKYNLFFLINLCIVTAQCSLLDTEPIQYNQLLHKHGRYFLLLEHLAKKEWSMRNPKLSGLKSQLSPWHQSGHCGPGQLHWTTEPPEEKKSINATWFTWATVGRNWYHKGYKNVTVKIWI